MTAIFITATGTDVGKTQVVASLIRQFRQMGRTVEAVKPIVSGYDPAQAAASDTGVLISALALPFSLQMATHFTVRMFQFASGVAH